MSVLFLQLSALEILAESLVGEMEEKEREHGRAAAARAEYAADAEEAQAWLQSAEARVQDRAAGPHRTREVLQEVSLEAGGVAERLERLSRNGQTLAERSASQQERDLATSTCASLTDQLGHLRHLLEQRKMAVCEHSYFPTLLPRAHKKSNFLLHPRTS